MCGQKCQAKAHFQVVHRSQQHLGKDLHIRITIYKLNLNYNFEILQGDVVDSEENQSPDGKADYTQIFSYIADPSHNGQKLRCYVDHLGYTEAQIESKENTAEADLELLCKLSFNNPDQTERTVGI